MLALNLHVHRDHAILSLDSSWSSLHKRGYRPIQPIAPLNEALAAGLLLRAGYDGTAPLALRGNLISGRVLHSAPISCIANYTETAFFANTCL